MASETVPSATQTKDDLLFVHGMEAHFASATGSCVDRLRNFTRFVPRQSLAAFLARREIFCRMVGIHGSIIECGVFRGGGLFAWSQLSSIYEPLNHTRRIVGFDTFRGFPALDPEDGPDVASHPSVQKHVGGHSFEHLPELEETRRLHDVNRPLGHIPRVEFVPGDAVETIPAYLVSNPHLVVALLYLDFDLYRPTKVAIETFLPRMPKGAIIAFDELSQKDWPGETLAVLEAVGLRNLRVERVNYVPQLSFAVLD